MDWTGGLILKIIFTLSNETHMLVGLHDAHYYPQNSFLLYAKVVNFDGNNHNITWAFISKNSQGRIGSKSKSKLTVS